MVSIALRTNWRMAKTVIGGRDATSSAIARASSIIDALGTTGLEGPCPAGQHPQGELGEQVEVAAGARPEGGCSFQEP